MELIEEPIESSQPVPSDVITEPVVELSKPTSNGSTSSHDVTKPKMTPMLVGRRQKNYDIKDMVKRLKPNWQKNIDLAAIQQALDELHENAPDGKPVHWRKSYGLVTKFLSDYFFLRPAIDNTMPDIIFSKAPDGKTLSWSRDQAYDQLKGYVLTVGKMKRSLGELLLGKPEGEKQKKPVTAKPKLKVNPTPSDEEEHDAADEIPEPPKTKPVSVGKRKRQVKPALKDLSAKMNGHTPAKKKSKPKITYTPHEQEDDDEQEDPKTSKSSSDGKKKRLRKNDHRDIEAKETSDAKLALELDEADEYDSDFIDDTVQHDDDDDVHVRTKMDKITKKLSRTKRSTAYIPHPPQEIVQVPTDETETFRIRGTKLPAKIYEGVESCLAYMETRYAAGETNKVTLEFDVQDKGHAQQFSITMQIKTPVVIE